MSVEIATVVANLARKANNGNALAMRTAQVPAHIGMALSGTRIVRAHVGHGGCPAPLEIQ